MKRIFVVAGPSGAGKTHLIEELVRRYPTQLCAPKLFTTRQPRVGEQSIDRQFVAPNQFKTKQARGDFAFVEEFGGSLYGYELAVFKPIDKHHLLNLTPGAAAKLNLKPAPVLIGMTVEPDKLELLWERMARRGDSAEAKALRMKTIYTDMTELEENRELFERGGRIFDIRDDQTAESIIDWIEANYLRKES